MDDKENKNWNWIDIIVLFIEVITPILSVVITCMIPAGKELEIDKRLLIIGLGINIPLISHKFSITHDQSKIDKEITVLSKKVELLSEKVNHISPVMEKVFLSDNKRLQRFAFRRFDELKKSIEYALYNGSTNILKPNEYYEELLHLANLIMEDKRKKKGRFAGEIWAMTGFAEDEWIADEGYEKQWTEKLKEITNEKIKTRRICLIPESVEKAIKNYGQEVVESSGSFPQFMELLKTYYRDVNIQKTTKHYAIIKASSPDELKKIGGFFAIKLTNGELHIVYGETCDANGALTASVLLDSNQIKEVRDSFDRFATDNNLLEKKIKEWSGNNGFTEYLKNNGINFL